MVDVDDPIRLERAVKTLEGIYASRFTVWKTGNPEYQFGVNLSNPKNPIAINGDCIFIARNVREVAESAGLEALAEGPAIADTLVVYVGLRTPGNPPKGHQLEFGSIRAFQIEPTAVLQDPNYKPSPEFEKALKQLREIEILSTADVFKAEAERHGFLHSGCGEGCGYDG